MKEKLSYNYCTTSLQIHFKAFDDKETQEKYFGVGVGSEHEELLQEIRDELQKFGSIDKLKAF